jgi:hypothetical protein
MRDWFGDRVGKDAQGISISSQPAVCDGDAAMAGADADHINSLRIGRQMINHPRFRVVARHAHVICVFYGNQTVTVLIIKEQLPDSGLMVGTNPVSLLACLLACLLDHNP